MQKRLVAALCALLMVLLMTGCGKETSDGGEKLSVVVTIFPEYDWVMQVLGDEQDRAEVTLLLDSGVDLHSYQPTADDLIRISGCDLFVCVGGESDEWTQSALQNPTNPDRVTLRLLDELGESAKAEELLEGMEGEEEDALDEHVWLSLKNAAVLTDRIADALSEIDPDRADAYAANAKAYIEKLNALDAQYAQTVAAASGKTLLFGDRFPFRYLADDYGLTCYAAFSGCSAESEASFETVAFLADKVDELGLNAVLTLEGSDGRIAQTVVDTTQAKNAKILTMDSMQSVTEKDVKAGASYLAVMEQNLSVLRDALR